MYNVCKGGMFFALVAASLSFGMDIINIKTLADDRVFELEKWKVKQSPVLGLLQAHQKRTTRRTKYIIVPESCHYLDTIGYKDVAIFSEWLNYQGNEQRNYFDTLLTQKKQSLICALVVLGATSQMAQCADYYFPADVLRLIVPKIIEGEFESHLIKKIIKNSEGHEPIKIDIPLYNSIAPQLSYFCKATCSRPTNLLKVTAYCGDDKRMVVCMGNSIVVWEYPSYKSRHWLKTIRIRNKDSRINSIVVYEKTGKIVVGCSDGTLHMIDIALGKEVGLLEGHKKSPINGLSRNDAYGIVVSSTNDISNNLMVWDGESGERLANVIGHPGINEAKISKDGQYIISISPREICEWQMYPDTARNMINSMKDRLTCTQAQLLYSLCKAIKNKTVVNCCKKEKLYTFLQESLIDIQIKEFLEKYLV
jgi:hypothetical protein